MNKLAILPALAAALIISTALAGSVMAEGFSVERFVVCTGVQDREPVGVSDSFDASVDRVYVFLEAKNITATTTVDIVWLHEGAEMLRTPLHLGQSSRWRTYAYKNLHDMDGQWSVELHDASGKSVASATFKVE